MIKTIHGNIGNVVYDEIKTALGKCDLIDKYNHIRVVLSVVSFLVIIRGLTLAGDKSPASPRAKKSRNSKKPKK